MKRTVTILITLTMMMGCMGTQPQDATPTVAPVTLDAQLNDLANQFITSLTGEGKSRLAILPFVDLNGDEQPVGLFVAEELTIRLYRTGAFEVVERSLLKQVLDEQALGASGALDSQSAAELGRLLGVQAIATGSITDLGQSLKVNARLISVDTGKLFSVASVTLKKDAQILALLGTEATAPVMKATAPTEPEELNRVEMLGNHEFTLVQCNRRGSRVICDLTIENTSNSDQQFTLWYLRCKLVDDGGNSYPIQQINLANQSPRILTEENWGGSQRSEITLLPGIPVKLKLVYANIPRESERLALLSLGYDYNLKVDFRDIPIHK